jgi:hypothetical protein
MNDGTDGQELERVANFYTGTEENPTSAQSAPTPRAAQDTSDEMPPGSPAPLRPPPEGPGDDGDDSPSPEPPEAGPGNIPTDGPTLPPAATPLPPQSPRQPLGPGATQGGEPSGGATVGNAPGFGLDSLGNSLTSIGTAISDGLGALGDWWTHELFGLPRPQSTQTAPGPTPSNAGPPGMWNPDEWLWFLGNRQKYQRPDGTWGWEPINKDPNFAMNWFQSYVVDDAAAAAGLKGVLQALRALRGGNPAPAAPNTSQNPQSGLPSAPAPDGTNTPPARFVVDRKGVITDTVAPKGVPKPTPNFQTPTNPPQLPPESIPPGWRIRQMPPTEQYPNGYWKLEKPMANGGWQPIDPSTMKPGGRPQTHVPLPPPSQGE